MSSLLAMTLIDLNARRRDALTGKFQKNLDPRGAFAALVLSSLINTPALANEPTSGYLRQSPPAAGAYKLPQRIGRPSYGYTYPFSISGQTAPPASYYSSPHWGQPPAITITPNPYNSKIRTYRGRPGAGTGALSYPIR